MYDNNTNNRERNLVSVDIGSTRNETDVNTGSKDILKRSLPNPSLKNRRNKHSSSLNPFIPKKRPFQRHYTILSE